MSPSSRLACLALNALAFIGFLSLVLPSAASPLPMPLPLMMADYTPSLVSANRSIAHFAPRRVSSSLRQSAHETNLDSPAELQLQKYLDGMAVSSGNLNNLATQSASVDPSDSEYQKAVVTEVKNYQTNFEGFQTVFATVSDSDSDKGLKNYVKGDVLETLLKDLVNFHKKFLNSVTTLVYAIPILGPILGPIVYQIKCIVDAILNEAEDLSDYLINKINLLLQELLPSLVVPSCNGVAVVGFCIL